MTLIEEIENEAAKYVVLAKNGRIFVTRGKRFLFHYLRSEGVKHVDMGDRYHYGRKKIKEICVLCENDIEHSPDIFQAYKQFVNKCALLKHKYKTAQITL